MRLPKVATFPAEKPWSAAEQGFFGDLALGVAQAGDCCGDGGDVIVGEFAYRPACGGLRDPVSVARQSQALFARDSRMPRRERSQERVEGYPHRCTSRVRSTTPMRSDRAASCRSVVALRVSASSCTQSPIRVPCGGRVQRRSPMPRSPIPWWTPHRGRPLPLPYPHFYPTVHSFALPHPNSCHDSLAPSSKSINATKRPIRAIPIYRYSAPLEGARVDPSWTGWGRRVGQRQAEPARRKLHSGAAEAPKSRVAGGHREATRSALDFGGAAPYAAPPPPRFHEHAMARFGTLLARKPSPARPLDPASGGTARPAAGPTAAPVRGIIDALTQWAAACSAYSSRHRCSLGTVPATA